MTHGTYGFHECTWCGKRWPVRSLLNDCFATHDPDAAMPRRDTVNRRIPGHVATARHRSCCSLGFALAVDLEPANRDHLIEKLGDVSDHEMWRALTTPLVEEGESDDGVVTITEYPALAPYVSEQGIGRHRRQVCCCFRPDIDVAVAIRFAPQSPKSASASAGQD